MFQLLVTNVKQNNNQCHAQYNLLSIIVRILQIMPLFGYINLSKGRTNRESKLYGKGGREGGGACGHREHEHKVIYLKKKLYKYI